MFVERSPDAVYVNLNFCSESHLMIAGRHTIAEFNYRSASASPRRAT